METAFSVSVSGEIEAFYLHLRDHDANRCACDRIVEEGEALSFRLAQARSDLKQALTALRRGYLSTGAQK